MSESNQSHTSAPLTREQQLTHDLRDQGMREFRSTAEQARLDAQPLDLHVLRDQLDLVKQQLPQIIREARQHVQDRLQQSHAVRELQQKITALQQVVQQRLAPDSPVRKMLEDQQFLDQLSIGIPGSWDTLESAIFDSEQLNPFNARVSKLQTEQQEVATAHRLQLDASTNKLRAQQVIAEVMTESASTNVRAFMTDTVQRVSSEPADNQQQLAESLLRDFDSGRVETATANIATVKNALDQLDAKSMDIDRLIAAIPGNNDVDKLNQAEASDPVIQRGIELANRFLSRVAEPPLNSESTSIAYLDAFFKQLPPFEQVMHLRGNVLSLLDTVFQNDSLWDSGEREIATFQQMFQQFTDLLGDKADYPAKLLGTAQLHYTANNLWNALMNGDRQGVAEVRGFFDAEFSQTESLYQDFLRYQNQELSKSPVFQEHKQTQAAYEQQLETFSKELDDLLVPSEAVITGVKGLHIKLRVLHRRKDELISRLRDATVLTKDSQVLQDARKYFINYLANARQAATEAESAVAAFAEQSNQDERIDMLVGDVLFIVRKQARERELGSEIVTVSTQIENSPEQALLKEIEQIRSAALPDQAQQIIQAVLAQVEQSGFSSALAGSGDQRIDAFIGRLVSQLQSEVIRSPGILDEQQLTGLLDTQIDRVVDRIDAHSQEQQVNGLTEQARQAEVKVQALASRFPAISRERTSRDYRVAYDKWTDEVVLNRQLLNDTREALRVMSLQQLTQLQSQQLREAHLVLDRATETLNLAVEQATMFDQKRRDVEERLQHTNNLDELDTFVSKAYDFFADLTGSKKAADRMKDYIVRVKVATVMYGPQWAKEPYIARHLIGVRDKEQTFPEFFYDALVRSAGIEGQQTSSKAEQVIKNLELTPAPNLVWLAEHIQSEGAFKYPTFTFKVGTEDRGHEMTFSQLADYLKEIQKTEYAINAEQEISPSEGEFLQTLTRKLPPRRGLISYVQKLAAEEPRALAAKDLISGNLSSLQQLDTLLREAGRGVKFVARDSAVVDALSLSRSLSDFMVGKKQIPLGVFDRLTAHRRAVAAEKYLITQQSFPDHPITTQIARLLTE